MLKLQCVSTKWHRAFLRSNVIWLSLQNFFTAAIASSSSYRSSPCNCTPWKLSFQAGSEIIVLWEKEKGNPRHSCFCGHSVLELITRIGGWVVLSLLFSFISFWLVAKHAHCVSLLPEGGTGREASFLFHLSISSTIHPFIFCSYHMLCCWFGYSSNFL